MSPAANLPCLCTREVTKMTAMQITNFQSGCLNRNVFEQIRQQTAMSAITAMIQLVFDCRSNVYLPRSQEKSTRQTAMQLQLKQKRTRLTAGQSPKSALIFLWSMSAKNANRYLKLEKYLQQTKLMPLRMPVMKSAIANQRRRSCKSCWRVPKASHFRSERVRVLTQLLIEFMQ